MAKRPKTFGTTKNGDFRRSSTADYSVAFTRPLPHVSENEIEFLLRIVSDEMEQLLREVKFDIG